MAIASQGRSLTFTATNEATQELPNLMEIVGMTFQGTGLTADQRLTVRAGAVIGSGSILADYIIEGTTDNADLWNGRQPQAVRGIAIDNTTVGGTWVLTVMVR